MGGLDERFDTPLSLPCVPERGDGVSAQLVSATLLHSPQVSGPLR